MKIVLSPFSLLQEQYLICSKHGKMCVVLDKYVHLVFQPFKRIDTARKYSLFNKAYALDFFLTRARKQTIYCTCICMARESHKNSDNGNYLR